MDLQDFRLKISAILPSCKSSIWFITATRRFVYMFDDIVSVVTGRMVVQLVSAFTTQGFFSVEALILEILSGCKEPARAVCIPAE